MRIERKHSCAPNDTIRINQNLTDKNIEIRFGDAVGNSTDSFSTQITGKELSEKLYEQIKKGDSSNKAFTLLSQINKNNIIEIIKNYPQNDKTPSLTWSLNKELGIDINTIKHYLLTPLLEKANELKVDLANCKDTHSIKDPDKLFDTMNRITQLVENKQEANRVLDYSDKIQKRFNDHKKCDINEFSVKNIRKQYPANEFKIEISNNNSDDRETKSIKILTLNDIPVKEYNIINSYGTISYRQDSYNESGQVTTNEYYREDGSISFKSVYSYEDNKTIQENYSIKENGIVQHYQKVYIQDENFNLVRSDLFEHTTGKLRSSQNKNCSIHFNDAGFKIYKNDDNSTETYYDNGTIRSHKENNSTKHYNPRGDHYLTITNDQENEYAIVDYFISALNTKEVRNYKFKETLLEISPEEVESILEQFKEKSGKDLTEEVKKAFIPEADKIEILNHITEVLEIKFGYDKNYTNESSKINHKYYQGDEYSIKFDEYKGEIYNKTKNQTFTIDLDYLLKDTTLENKIEYAAIIQQLPGQVLEDLSIECCGILKTPKTIIDKLCKKSKTAKNICDKVCSLFGYETSARGGFVNPLTPWMAINNLQSTIAHELGHLVDYSGDNYNLSHIISETYRNERREYLNNLGEKEYKEYAAANPMEMFAEVYEALMLDNIEHLDTLNKHFPKSVEMVIKEYENIRNTPQENRNSWKDATNFEDKNWLEMHKTLTMKILSPFGDFVKWLIFK